MNYHGLMKKAGLSVLLCALSANASAALLTFDVSGGFNSFVEDSSQGEASAQYTKFKEPYSNHTPGNSPEMEVDNDLSKKNHCFLSF